MNTYFVVRDTWHPEADLKRNWSSFAGGWDNELGFTAFETAEKAAEADMEVSGQKRTYRYHDKYQGFVCVHYEGLGAWALDAETLEEAIEEAKTKMQGLAETTEAGNGHFFAEDVVSYHQVHEGRWVFEVKY